MNTILNQTLAQIVTSNHQAASVFEKYHLDFCCKGKRPLADACLEKNLSTEKIVNELSEAMSKPVATSAGVLLDYISLSGLCDYIVATHHAYVKQASAQTILYLEKIASKHGDRHPELREIFDLFSQAKDELSDHMLKEETILFRRIKELEQQSNNATTIPHAAGYIEAPIAVMEHEHDSAGTLLEQIRVLTNDYTPPADACTTYRVAFASLQAFELDLHQHVHLENNILFPRAIEFIRKMNNMMTL
jgi:regulator of cell morphogenesis and NO signaling